MNIQKQVGVFLLLSFSSILFAGEEVQVINIEGYGVTRSEAVQSGLIEVVKQAKGVSIDAQKSFEKKITQNITSINGVPDKDISINNQTNSLVNEVTRGLIKSYEVLEYRKDGNGFVADMTVTISSYQTPGISPQSRRKIAVIPFHIQDSLISIFGGYIPSVEISRKIAQKITTELTQSRRFSVLDREHMDEYLTEKNLILSGNSSISEQSKLGEVLGVDYLLVGAINTVTFKKSPYLIQLTGEQGVNYSVFLEVDYRIIVMATQQVKWSDTVPLTLNSAEIKKLVLSLDSDQIQLMALNEIAERIVRKAMANIYPIRVVKTRINGEVILNQGGVTLNKGDVFNVFQPGEVIIDPYTGESLGPSEDWVADVKVIRVIPKMSYAMIIKGDIENVSEGNICRRAKNNWDSTIKNIGSSSDIEETTQGGVVLPFD